MSASAFSLSALFPGEHVFMEGETTVGGLHGKDQQHHHCAYCLSWIYTRVIGLDDALNIRATMFDDLNWFAPFIETVTEEKLSWVTLPVPHSFTSLPYAAEFPQLIESYAAQHRR